MAFIYIKKLNIYFLNNSRYLLFYIMTTTYLYLYYIYTFKKELTGDGRDTHKKTKSY